MHDAQIGASHVPLRFDGTFQSQRSVPGRPHLQRWRRPEKQTICAIIERVDHDGYAEPFVGMGGIFLRRSMRPKVEAINDISGDVITFFRVLQEHYVYFVDMLRFRVASRAEFERLNALPADRLTDLQRAARFLYLQRLAFGGKISGRNFGVSTTTPARFNVTKLITGCSAALIEAAGSLSARSDAIASS